MLRLQQYERLLKAMVVNQQLAGPVPELESIRANRVASVASQTLGQLMNQLLGNYLVTEGTVCPAPELASESAFSMSMSVQLSLSATEHQRLREDLKALVQLRNTLVHHFLERHDLWSLTGCQQACAALTEADALVDRHLEQLKGWAKGMDEARSKLADFVNSEAAHDLIVDGLAPNGQVVWPYAGCVQALRTAAQVLAVEGWTSVAAAGQWIVQHHPEQMPRRYGCSSWHQVIHESRLFETKRREVDGRFERCYRPTPDAST
ncbi:hypothetical protein AR540_13020 [Pseudomonas sp. EpS/L25]|nr:hypothetical protein AR540_13020 [Pseudomonas sp. EpS/L25]